METSDKSNGSGETSDGGETVNMHHKICNILGYIYI